MALAPANQARAKAKEERRREEKEALTEAMYTGKSGKSKSGKGSKESKSSSKAGKGGGSPPTPPPTPIPGPGTPPPPTQTPGTPPPTTQTPETPPPTQTPETPPPTPTPGTPPPTQTPETPPPTQTPETPPPTQTPGTPPPTQTPETPPPTQTPETPPPTQTPGTPPPTQTPGTPPTCSVFTEAIFKAIAPEPKSPYSYEGFCNAVTNWNNNPSFVKIFLGAGEKQKDELAAFFGHVLHESDVLKAPREYSQCENFVSEAGKVYCKPVGYTGGNYRDPYCDTGLAGCSSCELVPEGITVNEEKYIEADKLFFGRGPLQTTWNYNYQDFQNFLNEAGVNICATPDLLATNEEYAWKSAFSFWTRSKGRKAEFTSHEAVVGQGDFGSTLDIINGGLECPGNADKVERRLNYYCIAASAFEVTSLLKMDGCEGMKKVLDDCIQSNQCQACGVWNK